MALLQAMLASGRSFAEMLIESLRRRNASPLYGRGRDRELDDEEPDQPTLELFNEEPAPTPKIEAIRPDEAAAAVLLGRALDLNRAAAAALADRESVTVIDVPSNDLVDLIGPLVTHHLFDPMRICDGDGAAASWPRGPQNAVTIFTRNGLVEKRTRNFGNENFAIAMQRGAAVIGISADSFRLLPSDLSAFATQRIRVEGLDATSVAAVVAAVTGGPIPKLTGVMRGIGLQELMIAVRHDLGATRSVERLERIVSVKSAAEAIPLLSQLHGLGEAKVWGLSLIEDLRDLRDGMITAADLPRGIVLHGPPGTGKTLFARSLAKEAGVYFRATSYAEWQSHREGHLGHVVQAIRSVFAEAAARAPCIIFIDEIDTLAARGSKKRDDDWWVAITNTLLEELDSVDPGRRRGVVVVAACNDVGRLDPALIRPGRLDRTVRIPLPDVGALAAIMRAHLGARLGIDDLMQAAVEARGSTGAEVERWARAARRRARRDGRDVDARDMLSEVRAGKTQLGPVQKQRLAYHESGHALVSYRLDSDVPVSLSIVDARGGSASFDGSRLSLLTRPEIENLIARVLAGRAAEQVALGNISEGGAADLVTATKLASGIECSFGLGNYGPLSFGEEPRIAELMAIPEAAASLKSILATAHDRAVKLIEADRSTLNRLAAALIKRGYLEREEIARVLSTIAPGADEADGAQPNSPMPGG